MNRNNFHYLVLADMDTQHRESGISPLILTTSSLAFQETNITILNPGPNHPVKP